MTTYLKRFGIYTGNSVFAVRKYADMFIFYQQCRVYACTSVIKIKLKI